MIDVIKNQYNDDDFEQEYVICFHCGEMGPVGLIDIVKHPIFGMIYVRLCEDCANEIIKKIDDAIRERINDKQ